MFNETTLIRSEVDMKFPNLSPYPRRNKNKKQNQKSQQNGLITFPVLFLRQNMKLLEKKKRFTGNTAREYKNDNGKPK